MSMRDPNNPTQPSSHARGRVDGAGALGADTPGQEADRSPEPPEECDRFPEDLLVQSLAARQRYFEHQVIIDHPALLESLRKLENALFFLDDGPSAGLSDGALASSPPATYPGPQGAAAAEDRQRFDQLILLLGPSRVGKTTLISMLLDILAARARPRMLADPGYIPYVCLSLPGREIRRFDWPKYYESVLRALRDPFVELPTAGRHRIGDLREAMEAALVARKAHVVIVDEAQHFTKVAREVTLQDQMDLIKGFINRTHVNHVLVGTYEMRQLRRASAQLGLRASDVHFQRYDPQDPQQVQQFLGVLAALQRELPLAVEPDLVGEHAEYLFARSLGVVGILKQHLVRALTMALDQGAETITRDHLRAQATPLQSLEKELTEISNGEDYMREPTNADEQLQVQLGMRAPDPVQVPVPAPGPIRQLQPPGAAAGPTDGGGDTMDTLQSHARPSGDEMDAMAAVSAGPAAGPGRVHKKRRGPQRQQEERRPRRRVGEQNPRRRPIGPPVDEVPSR